MAPALRAMWLAVLPTVVGCAAPMYSRPLGSGEKAVQLDAIVAVDLLAFDGKEPAASSLNSWKVTSGPHHLTVQVNYRSVSQTIRSSPKTAMFDLEQGHSYQVGFRAHNQKTTTSVQGTHRDGNWEIALYDTTSNCVVLDSAATCHPVLLAPWRHGWFWSL